jgi:hypothetical protein
VNVPYLEVPGQHLRIGGLENGETIGDLDAGSGVREQYPVLELIDQTLTELIETVTARNDGDYRARTFPDGAGGLGAHRLVSLELSFGVYPMETADIRQQGFLVLAR